MTVQLRVERREQRRRYDIGGNAVTRPDDQRSDQQEYVVATSVMFDDAGFGQGFGLFDQHFIAAEIGLREVFERRVHCAVVAGAQQAVDDRGEFSSQ